MQTSKISDKVSLVDTRALGQEGTVAVYVVRGKKTAVVDCGYASSHENVLQGLGELGVDPSEVEFLIPTHVHLDHAGATGHLSSRMRRATVIAHERAIPHLADPTRLVQSATSVFGEEMIAAFGRPVPVERERMIAVGEEMHLDLGGITLTMLHTPGHAPHQISILVEEEHLLLSADAVGIVYPSVPTLIPTTPPPSFDPFTLGQTTRRLAQLEARSLLAPHFGVREDIEEVLERTRRKTDEWVEETRKLRAKNLGLDSIATEFRRRVAAEAGLKEESDLPPYAGISIRTSIMGIMHYLDKSSQPVKG